MKIKIIINKNLLKEMYNSQNILLFFRFIHDLSCYMSIMLYLLQGNILSPFQTMSWVVWSVSSKGIWGLIT